MSETTIDEYIVRLYKEAKGGSWVSNKEHFPEAISKGYAEGCRLLGVEPRPEDIATARVPVPQKGFLKGRRLVSEAYGAWLAKGRRSW